MRHIVFFGLMALSSATTILKMAVLAAVFPATEFAEYASAFALVGLVANFVSFGLTDGLVKRYVRLFEFGRLSELDNAIWENTATLSKRTIYAAVLTIPACWFYFGSEGVIPSAAVLTLALASNVFTIISALFLGLNRQNGMAIATLLRSVLALIIVAALGVVFGWRMGFLLEAISTMAIGICFLVYLRTEVGRSKVQPSSNTERHVSGERDGLWLFIAYTAALVPFSFDRLWVTWHSSAASSAQYAFAAIWIAAGYTVCAIYTQKFGPDIVRSQASATHSDLLRTSAKHAVAVCCFVLALSLCSFLFLYIVFPNLYWKKFDLSFTLAIAISLVSAIQITRIFDWALISIDGEAGVLASNLVFSGLAILFFAIGALFNATAIVYLLAFGAARLVQIAITAIWIQWYQHKRQS